MKQICILSILFMLMLFTGSGKGFAEEPMPGSMITGSETLVLNGKGTRTKFFLTLYEAGLYLRERSDDAGKIVAAESPMAIRLLIKSSMITSEKMEKATLEGFEKSTHGNTAALVKEIEQFISVFREEIRVDDVYEMIYLPSKGVQVIKNNKQAAIIPGLAFKKALFGIWLSPDPVQESLKRELLGTGT